MSLGFYAWGEPKAIIVMIFSIILNYCGGLIIEQSITRNKRPLKKVLTCLVVVMNLLILFYYKYFDFAISSINKFFSLSIPLRNISLPIGISFFIFQGMSYVLDVSMQKVRVQKNPLNIALYISLFPQLIAGPIVRYSEINNEIENRKCSINCFSSGIYRFSIGLMKKTFLANTLGKIADSILSQDSFSFGTLVAWFGIICYSFQIYYDFSGYSDMAIGLGKMFGFHFQENFNYPYSSVTITDFWRRWHISLSSWFKDYVYIPLGGNRKGNQYIHLLTVFLLTGLWHGASWNFVLWGLWHGFYIIMEKFVIKRNKGIIYSKWVRFVIRLYTLLVILLGWVFFRIEKLPLAMNFIGILFHIKSNPIAYTINWYMNGYVFFAFFIAILAAIPWKYVFPKQYNYLKHDTIGLLLQNIITIIFLIIGIILCMTSTYNPFIYFRF